MKIEENIKHFFLNAKKKFFIIFTIIILIGFSTSIVSMIIRDSITEIDIIHHSIIMIIGLISLILIFFNKIDIGIIIFLFSLLTGRIVLSVIDSFLYKEISIDIAHSFGTIVLYMIILGFFINRISVIIFTILSISSFIFIGLQENTFEFIQSINLSVLLIIIFVFIIYFSNLQNSLIKKSNIETENQKRLVKERESLLKEIHHRVKNNMQIMYSLNRLQSRSQNNEEASNILRDNRERIRAMSLVHEIIYQSDNLYKVNLRSYISRLTESIFNQYKVDNDNIKINIEIEESLELNLDTIIPVGLIINEIAINSIKYAFPKNKKGMIHINMNSNENQKYSLRIKDNGIGIDKTIDVYKANTLGLQLVIGLTEQLRGTIILNRKDGTEYIFEFHELEPYIRS